ncbi:MAG TPA: AAA family ATPase [Thermoplasmata archaeon]|nr:AAA family ATPase [Thermoplasmata archaeon]
MTSVALTGTPGTGKSTVAARLISAWRTVEVSDLALQLRTGRRIRSGSEVDVRATARAWRAGRAPDVDVVVGHLSHLLPIRDVVVLRCHPRELARRLGRARRGSERERFANLVCEATDAVLVESLSLHRRVWEVDTTGRTPESVAREVARRIRRRGPPSYGRVDWLSDAWVGKHLLDWSR